VLLWIAGGYFWIDYQEQYVDYSPWLGPDWEPSFEKKKAPTLVGNHTSWIDVHYALHMFLPSFVARARTKNMRFIGKFADYLNSIYVDRYSKDSKTNTGDMIKAH
jgi:1-acyl-sn-glycerol-3-phosphate acyltransferase